MVVLIKNPLQSRIRHFLILQQLALEGLLAKNEFRN